MSKASRDSARPPDLGGVCRIPSTIESSILRDGLAEPGGGSGKDVNVDLDLDVNTRVEEELVPR